MKEARLKKSTCFIVPFLCHSEKANRGDRKEIRVCQGLGVGRGGEPQRGTGEFSDRNIWYLEYGGSYVCQNSQDHILSQRVNFTVCKSCLNKQQQRNKRRQLLGMLQDIIVLVTCENTRVFAKHLHMILILYYSYSESKLRFYWMFLG